MRKSRAEAAETRKKIIETAAAEFRSKGVQATRVVDVMSAAGLTHGGFYRHFESKEDLLNEACTSVLRQMKVCATDAVDSGRRAYEKYVSDYLSLEYHSDGKGCPFATIGSELAHADEPTRHTLSNGFRTWVDIFSRQSPEEDPEAAEADAVFKLAAMVGAVTMARIVDDEAFAQEILTQARSRILGKPVRVKKVQRSSAAKGSDDSKASA